MNAALLAVASLPVAAGVVVAAERAVVASLGIPAIVGDAGAKGRGAFAREPQVRGALLGSYAGERLGAEAFARRYPLAGRDPEFVFRLGAGSFLDASDGSHWTRFVNHAEPSAPERNVDAVVLPHLGVYLFASRDIAAGEEFRMAYGPRYWVGRETSRVA